MARLSTHVLDLSSGRPAGSVRVDLSTGESVVTNPDGRAEFPQVEPGVYELTFHAGDYFRAAGIEIADPPFLDQVVIRFGVSGNCHVPLLLSPYGYSTYRGS